MEDGSKAQFSDRKWEETKLRIEKHLSKASIDQGAKEVVSWCEESVYHFFGSSSSFSAQTSSKKCTDDCLTCPTTCPCKYETQKDEVKNTKNTNSIQGQNYVEMWVKPRLFAANENHGKEETCINEVFPDTQSNIGKKERQESHCLGWTNLQLHWQLLEKTGPLFHLFSLWFVIVIVFLLIHGFVIGAVRPSANALLFPPPANKALSLCFTRTLIKTKGISYLFICLFF